MSQKFCGYRLKGKGVRKIRQGNSSQMKGNEKKRNGEFTKENEVNLMFRNGLFPREVGKENI